jgi:Potential Queuosine, Q, salvage protein family
MHQPLPSHCATLGVAEAAQQVTDRARHVAIDDVALERFCAGFAQARMEVPAWNTHLHFHDNSWRTANYVLVLDALNFCFWSDAGQPRWYAQRGETRYNGYWGLAVALRNALEAGMPLLEAEYLADIQTEAVQRLFACEYPIPLLEARVEHLREVGRVLLQRYDGRFTHMIEACNRDAVTLAWRVAQELRSFHDYTTYEGLEVPVLKRAQILAVDLYGTFGGQGWGELGRLEAITAFADYKVPQVLRREGILVYTPALAETLERLEEIPANDPREVEIRCATVHAVELIRNRMGALATTPKAFEVDWYLWDRGQQPSPHDRPYHRTRTVYY